MGTKIVWIRKHCHTIENVQFNQRKQSINPSQSIRPSPWRVIKINARKIGIVKNRKEIWLSNALCYI